MKKVFILSIFSLLALAPFPCALAQGGGNAVATKAVEKSSAGTGSTTDERKLQDPASEAAGGQATSTNQNLLPTLAESTEANSNVDPKASAEAQKNYNDGVALYDSGKLVEAISAFKAANKLKPNDAQVQYMLGMAYWKTKAYNDARGSFERAVRIKPDWAEAHYKLGLAYYVLGRSNKTNEEYEKLLELNSPLANNLYRINNDAKKTNAAERPKAGPAASTSNQIEFVPVSTSASVDEKPLVTVSESNGLSTTAASLDKAMPAVAPANEAPSPALSELKNAPPTAVSSGAATTSTTTPLNRAATSDAITSNNSATATDDSALTGIYKVGVGDVLDVRLLNSANRSTLYSVVEGGLIDLPIAGRPISVAGLTTKEIEALITSELKRLAVEQQTQVTVGVRQYSSHTVIITGLVGNPGTKTLRREAVPLYVLLAEVQPRQDAARAAIMREGAPTQVMELSDPLALHFIVRPGDVISLTARPQEFYYIAGRIDYPGQKVFQPGITLLQAILAAGGMVRESEVELSREGSDGHLTTTKFKLKEIKAGKILDPKLQPGDRIEVFN